MINLFSYFSHLPMCFGLFIFYFSAFSVSFFHSLIPLSCITGHGLPVLNEEGTLATPDIDKGSWVSESSSSEVQFSHQIILCLPTSFLIDNILVHACCSE